MRGTGVEKGSTVDQQLLKSRKMSIVLKGSMLQIAIDGCRVADSY